MVETTPELKMIIQRFRAELKNMGIHCEQILLFGSQATGSAREGSDIDSVCRFVRLGALQRP